ncbi:MAG: zinc ribbon domain-containing protein [Candidatus Binatus sp.]|uniref:FmdB family zinc ribbon protein n=1 Tax=Candidatus Binatus sp. TaxID=2811406 RepID=UPI00271E0596|nr:zinc ribbon domain-containing protein [Candidatus Binatus sp.]MDO8434142.1 zinc ribbon domain-containing protein [Candidatus Binatus sp.]
MPIYEYKCSKCGVFEVMQGIKEPSLRKCPTCKGKVERQISRGSFILKGSGWYATDYAKKSPSSGTEASETTKTNGDSSSASNESSKSSSESSKSSSDTSKSSSESSGKESKPASESKSTPEKAAAAKPAA